MNNPFLPLSQFSSSLIQTVQQAIHRELVISSVVGLLGLLFDLVRRAARDTPWESIVQFVEVVTWLGFAWLVWGWLKVELNTLLGQISSTSIP